MQGEKLSVSFIYLISCIDEAPAALRKTKEEEFIPSEQLCNYTYEAYARQVCSEYHYDLLESYSYDIIKEKKHD